MRTTTLLPLTLLALIGCSSAPVYLEAYGHFGDGTPIDFREDAMLQVGTDPLTGDLTAHIRAVTRSGAAFTGMVVQVDLAVITAPGQYATHHDGSGGAQLHILTGDPDNTEEWMADGTLDILELPIDGNDRFAGSFSSVVVSYQGQDITGEQGTFRGQL